MLAAGADVNETNDAGQTPLILAIVAGQLQLLRPLLRAGADPALRDNTGLSASDWAVRKGEIELAQSLGQSSQTQRSNQASEDARTSRTEKRPTPPPAAEQSSRPTLSAEEKARRFVAGLKQRLDEKASREAARPVSPDELLPPPTDAVSQELSAPAREAPRSVSSEEVLRPAPEKVPPVMVTEVDVPDVIQPPTPSPSLHKTARGPSKRKRCPECGATYNSELLAYCSYDAAPLVDADQTGIPTRSASPGPSPMLWIMIVVVLVLGTLAGLFVTNRFLRPGESNTQTAAAPETAPTQKGTAALGRPLAGKELSLPEAEVPANTVQEPVNVRVRVRIDREGRVSSAVSEDSEGVVRDAAIAAAKRATFSPEKLRGRGAEGTITYSFK